MLLEDISDERFSYTSSEAPNVGTVSGTEAVTVPKVVCRLLSVERIQDQDQFPHDVLY